MKMFKLSFITLFCVSGLVNAGMQEFIDSLRVFLNMEIAGQLDEVEMETARFLAHNVEAKSIKEKLNFCFELFGSLENLTVSQEYQDLRQELISTVFHSIDFQQAENRKETKTVLLSFSNPKFIEYVGKLVQEKEDAQGPQNRLLNSLFLELRLSSQIKTAVKPRGPVVPARDIVQGGLNAIDGPDIQGSHESEDNPLADTVLITTNFTEAVTKETEIEQAQKILHAKLDRLEQERTRTWNVRIDFELVLEQHTEHIRDEIRQVLLGYINELKETEQQRVREIEDAKASGGMLDLQKLLADVEKQRWQPLFQQKLDQRNQERLELERKLKAVNEALDSLESQRKGLEQKEASTHGAQRLLVASQMNEKLKEGAFNPKRYTSS